MSDRFARGFSTLEQEITCDRLPVKGTVPGWLAGTLLRNGPGKFEIGKQNYHHWFDGLAMLHRFSFRNGEVSYANRFLRSSPYTEGVEKGKIRYSEFATDPCRSLFKRLATVFAPPDQAPIANANVNIIRLAGTFIAMTETPIPVQFDPQTLETVGVFDYHGKLPGELTTAHPHYDPALHAGINYLTHLSARSSYNVYAFDAHGRRLIGSHAAQEPAYMHSFGMTEHYVILVEFPLVVNPLSILLSGKPFIENFVWKPERGARFLVMSKQDGNIVGTYESEAFFAFHHINAFEQDGDLLVDVAAFPDASIIRQLYLGNLLGPKGGVLTESEYRRYRLPAGGATARYERLSEESIELPRINYEQNNGHEYRFAYGVSQQKAHPDDFLNQLVKVDVIQRSARTWFEEDSYPGEPVFVAAPDATGEDEGVILSVVLDGERGRSFLLVLDAASFTELARAEVPHTIPFGFHGIYAR